jgi:hypothetical protein
MVDRSKQSRLSFDAIARNWAGENRAPGSIRGEVLQVLVSAMWRGEFETNGAPTLSLPIDPPASGPGDDDKSGTELEGTTMRLYPEKWARLNIYDGVMGIDRYPPPLDPDENAECYYIPQPPPSEERYEKMATTPLSDFEPHKVAAYFENLWIGRDDFEAWAIRQGRALPEFWFPPGQAAMAEPSDIQPGKIGGDDSNKPAIDGAPGRGRPVKFTKFYDWLDLLLKKTIQSSGSEWGQNRTVENIKDYVIRRHGADKDAPARPQDRQLRKHLREWRSGQKSKPGSK